MAAVGKASKITKEWCQNWKWEVQQYIPSLWSIDSSRKPSAVEAFLTDHRGELVLVMERGLIAPG
jgi:hypothetical protein